MRIAVLADIHGNLPALEAVLADAEAAGCGAFWNLGDLVSGPLWPAETAALLQPLGWPTIRGNHERQLAGDPAHMGASDRFAHARLTADQRDWLSGLPCELVLGGAYLVHGTPESDLDYLLDEVREGRGEPAAPGLVRERLGGRAHPITLCGHSHMARVIDLGAGRQAANPGSVGLPAYQWDRPVQHRNEMGSPAARYLILDGHALELRAVEYDHHAAAAKAEREGFGDWAFALATGRAGPA